MFSNYIYEGGDVFSLIILSLYIKPLKKTPGEFFFLA